jgi:hypothetical protein
VSAKDIEGTLRTEEQPVRESNSLAELQAAFKRAAHLRDQPYVAHRIRSKHGKGFSHNEVLVTNDREGRYVRVLIPYSAQQLAQARPKFFLMQDNQRPHLRRGKHFHVYHHEQWVRDDRLVRVV